MHPAFQIETPEGKTIDIYVFDGFVSGTGSAAEFSWLIGEPASTLDRLCATMNWRLTRHA